MFHGAKSPGPISGFIKSLSCGWLWEIASAVLWQLSTIYWWGYTPLSYKHAWENMNTHYQFLLLSLANTFSHYESSISIGTSWARHESSSIVEGYHQPPSTSRAGWGLWVTPWRDDCLSRQRFAGLSTRTWISIVWTSISKKMCNFIQNQSVNACLQIYTSAH